MKTVVLPYDISVIMTPQEMYETAVSRGMPIVTMVFC